MPTVVPVLVAGHLHDLAALKAACVDLIRANSFAVMMSTPSIEFKNKDPLLWREVRAALGLPEEEEGGHQREEQDSKRARRES